MTSTSTSPSCAVRVIGRSRTHRGELLVLLVAAIARRVGVRALLVEQVGVLAGKLEGVLDSLSWVAVVVSDRDAGFTHRVNSVWTSDMMPSHSRRKRCEKADCKQGEAADTQSAGRGRERKWEVKHEKQDRPSR